MRLYVNCLGTPEFLDDAGRSISSPTRKSLAILIYLLRTPGRLVPREQIADILWSTVPQEKSVQSFRQALRQLRRVEEASGVNFLAIDKKHVGLIGNALVLDIEQVSDLLETGSIDGFETALQLIRGPLLNGYETLDPVFHDWLTIERQRLMSDFTSAAIKVVDGLSAADDPGRVEAGCRFLLALDSACEPAHQILIKMYLATGRKAEARQQLKLCEAELKTHLDVAPEDETYRLFEHPPSGNDSLRFATEPIWGMVGVNLRQGDSDGKILLPRLTIVPFAVFSGLENCAQTMLDDIRTCLGAYRNIELYEGDYQIQGGATKVTLLDAGDELGSYVLRFRYDEKLALIYLQLEDRISGQVLFNEVIELNSIVGLTDLREVTSQTVNRIQSRVIGRLRTLGSKQPFLRWCQAEALLCEFSQSADEEALRILNEVQEHYPGYSVIYSGKASVGLKKILHFPEFNAEKAETDTFLDLAEKAVVLDPWQVVNRRMHGWSLLQTGHCEDAKRSFLEAARLNPFDPTNLMSVAEGLAYIGDVEQAQKQAERAFALLSVVPRFFYEYLANIKFASGDYATTLELLDRAPQDGIMSITTRTAACLGLNRENEARETLDLLSKRHSCRFAFERADRPEEIVGWLSRINLYQNSETRMRYKRGADMVLSYLMY
ncbi:BTAD domain-containing putative transcriptional regulator [Roseibium algae]|uniref:BTAD domain-containing putative transcriptional regulator n=1 Tax=Roseibium algae TaxID=3123038 RepID=A0ABU8TKF7_9HYPH